jgi:hypothetical protein
LPIVKNLPAGTLSIIAKNREEGILSFLVFPFIANGLLEKKPHFVLKKGSLIKKENDPF